VPTSGDVLGDRYRLDDLIASGGMGEVWRATDTLLGRGVAVKVLQTRGSDDPGFQVRFRHEARTMAMLHHPGVADVYDYGETGDGEDAYIVMAYVDGEPLDKRIGEAGRLDPATTMSIVAQAARALHAAHAAGIVHRDVKPGNLVIRPDGTVVLVDFGVARSANSLTLTGADEVVGTALYIAPEQVSKKATGPGTDIYALGAVAYHCLAGHPPFLGNNALSIAMHHLNDEPPPLPADVPEQLRGLVATAMAKDPADRFGTAEEMADAAAGAAPLPTTRSADAPADAIADGRTTTARPTAAAGTPRPSRRRAMAWALVLVSLAVVGVLLSFAVPGDFLPGPSDPPASPQDQPPGSAGPDQDRDQGGDQGGDPGNTADPAGPPDATAPPGGEEPGGEDPGGDDPEEPAPSGPGGTDPTPPPDDDPTGPEPTPTAAPEASAAAGQQPPATRAPAG
jgi:serine/threonine-protein kinase